MRRMASLRNRVGIPDMLVPVPGADQVAIGVPQGGPVAGKSGPGIIPYPDLRNGHRGHTGRPGRQIDGIDLRASI